MGELGERSEPFTQASVLFIKGDRCSVKNEPQELIVRLSANSGFLPKAFELSQLRMVGKHRLLQSIWRERI